MKILRAGPSESLILTNSGEGRKSGVHLSDILKRMAFEKDKRYNPENPIDAMTLECGFTWETVLETALKARHKDRAGYRPDQLREDGIWLSPDWVNPKAEIQHEEWKATRKSTKNFEAKLDEWAPQIKSYLRALLRAGVAHRLATRMRVWFMVGDWTFEAKGDHTLLRDYWDIDIEFSKRELEENWQQIISAGQRYGLLKGEPTWEKKKKSDSQPPVKRRENARIVTFPTTKRSRTLPNAS